MPRSHRTAAALAALLLCLGSGCTAFENLTRSPLEKRYLENRYPANPVKGLRTVAVAVLDASAKYPVDTAEFTRALHAELQNVEGLEVLPVAAVAAAVRRDGSLALPRDGLKVADALGADGVFVAVVTNYDPYREPVVAAGLTLFSRVTAPIGPVELDRVIQGGKPLPMPEGPQAQPVTAVFDVYDASQQTLRERIRLFAEARTAAEEGLGWERYYRSSRRYMQFVSYELVWEVFTKLGAPAGQE